MFVVPIFSEGFGCNFLPTNLTTTGTEVSRGGDPESLAMAMIWVSVWFKWSRSSITKSPEKNINQAYIAQRVSIVAL